MLLPIGLVYESETNRWWAHIEALPGVAQYGATKEKAIKEVKVIAIQTLLWMLEDGDIEDIDSVQFSVLEPELIAA